MPIGDDRKEATMIKAADRSADVKVMIDTVLAWDLIPAGMLHTISSTSPASMDENKHPSPEDCPSFLQLINKSGAPNLTFAYPLSSTGY